MIEREYFYCPVDDGEDFPGSTNCGGADFGSRLALDLHWAAAHLALDVARPASVTETAAAVRELAPFVAGDEPRQFHGAPVIPHTGGWGLLDAGAGIGQGLPQALYAIWSEGTPIAWYLNDSTDEGWVHPQGDYYDYGPVTAIHQHLVGRILRLAGEHPRVTPPWLAAMRAAFAVDPAEVPGG